MIKPINLKNISEKRNYLYIIGAIVFFVLLLLRDAYSVEVNKYVFLAIVCVCAVLLRTKDIIYLFCFLFPLYVGLPGNYMTIVLIIRLLFEINRFKLSSLILSVLVAVYIFVQNIVTRYTGTVPMMFVVGIILILLLFTYKENLEPIPMIVMYSAGVAALGIIMLVSTLNVYELSDLMETSFRLGSSNVDYVSKEIMNVSIDPNFYGTFAIASISTAFPVIFKYSSKSFVKLCLAVFVGIQIVVALIGLSRAFIIIFAVWAVLYLLLQKNIKRSLLILVVIALIITLLINFMPTVIETVFARFEDSDMATGNGRITLARKFLVEWSGGIMSFIFGVGLYKCNVHCTPLQFLFGGGLVTFSLAVALFFSYKPSKMIGRSLSDFLPFIVTFVMMCTVPAAGILNFMFPLVYVGLSVQNTKDEGKTLIERSVATENER